jgi:hypothetical protein
LNKCDKDWVKHDRPRGILKVRTPGLRGDLYSRRPGHSPQTIIVASLDPEDAAVDPDNAAILERNAQTLSDAGLQRGSNSATSPLLHLASNHDVPCQSE